MEMSEAWCRSAAAQMCGLHCLYLRAFRQPALQGSCARERCTCMPPLACLPLHASPCIHHSHGPQAVTILRGLECFPWLPRLTLRLAGQVLLQSDVEEAAAAMRDQFERHGAHAFQLAGQHQHSHVFFSQVRNLLPMRNARVCFQWVLHSFFSLLVGMEW